MVNEELLSKCEAHVRRYGTTDKLTEHQPTADYFGSRHKFAFMAFLGLAVVYMMRVNLSVTIVDMVRMPSSSATTINTTKRIPTSTVCPIRNSPTTFTNDGEFDWDIKTQGLVLGSFFWGYTVTQIPGGLLARKCGGKNVLGIGIFLTGLLSFATPSAARSSIPTLITVRILTGLAEGVTLPAVHHMLSAWVPTQERSTIGAFVLAGMQFGTVLALPLSGFLCDVNLDGGWPLAFYVPGFLAVIWFLGWWWAVSDSPENDPHISEDERKFIQISTGNLQRDATLQTPWLDMATSVHVWAILIAHIGKSWGFSILLTELPTYLNTVLHFNMKANCLLSAMPYMAMWLCSIIFSFVADALRSKHILSTTQTRKLFNTIGFIAPAIAFVGASFTGCDQTATVTLIILATAFIGAVYSGFEVNHIDIAPEHAGVLMGITNCLASTCGFIAPYVISRIVTTQGSVDQWRIVFLLSAGVYVVTNFFYVIFATGEEQQWNRAKRSETS
ncbi:putative inorganic phosphate cotransporter isoform X1 [Daphnia magna]|uniref:putative inorganic phosphate cotransporter isoform X1 n=1 Tax=Daphnia magna TaxID=35525 RepID=UPI001E1BD56B|nr:putative inorganic phosphate cotransporter isoform X1 [Daphnia magna]XP_045026536.1 putative inorganic phosphate cotransporter isoform X1 [Daphnia magna]